MALMLNRPFPPSIFLYVNLGDHDDYSGEYDSYYRVVGVNSARYSLLFYKFPESSVYTLGIGSNFPSKWVWAANPNDPVSDGAAIYLGEDGNLVLVDVDDRVVWQTNTANKGVVGLKMLEDGNMVLYDANDNFIWQSFDYPSDTLLPSQSLKAGLTTKLVSRASNTSHLEGNYTLEMSPKNVSLYYKSPNSPTPLPYYRIDQSFVPTFSKEFRYDVFVKDFDNPISSQTIQYTTTSSLSSSSQELVKTSYDSRLSLLRLEYDGKLRVHTFDPMIIGVWYEEFTLFKGEPLSRNQLGATECQMPEKCGNFGICYKGECVACPSPRGLMRWSEDCAPPTVGGNSGDDTDAKYYKMRGIRHFSCMYTEGEGPMKPRKCKIKCSNDPKCVGFFYDVDNLRCWIVYDLMTLTRTDNPNHLGYVKLSN
uniref:Bulb-type lectin domain-containing protein n=2 Tax=Chenopodium quinoa TaxID=63459 RepID=A0A803LC62_CHEQI